VFPVPFTPDFQFYIDYDYNLKQFFVRNTFTEAVESYIPKHIMSKIESKTLRYRMNRFRWLTNDTFMYALRNGHERCIKRVGDHWEEVGFGLIPYYNLDDTFNHHFYLEPKYHSHTDVLERLKESVNLYKRSYYVLNKRDPESLHESMFVIDYTDSFTDDLKRCRLHLSFTFLHWRIMEQLLTKEESIDAIDKQTFECLLLNILPTGQSVLHYSHKRPDIIQAIFKRLHNNPDNPSEISFMVPFMQDVNGKSPLDFCLNCNEMSTANVMLKYLQHYPFDHHSRSIENSLPTLVANDVSEFFPYLDSRTMVNELTAQMTRGAIS